MKKRLLSMLLAGLLGLSLAGCAAGGATGGTDKNDKIQIVTTIFPEYDWVRQVVGKDNDRVEVTLLQKDGTDLHSYQPTVEDMAKISDADMFIYVGGESSEWAKDALKNKTNKNQVAINDMKVLGDRVKDEEVKEGMQESKETTNEAPAAEAKGTADGSSDSDGSSNGVVEKVEETPEQDEHIWLSLKNAETIVQYIGEQLGTLDDQHKKTYEKNADAYIDRLAALDEQYQETVEASKQNTLIVGDRFPFRYLVDDYGIDYYAAFAGCSAETDASFETVVFLAKKLDELMLKDIIVLESSDRKVAQSIQQATNNRNQNIVVLNSMQSITHKDIDAGATYYELMKNNLGVLKTVLND